MCYKNNLCELYEHDIVHAYMHMLRTYLYCLFFAAMRCGSPIYRSHDDPQSLRCGVSVCFIPMDTSMSNVLEGPDMLRAIYEQIHKTSNILHVDYNP